MIREFDLRDKHGEDVESNHLETVRQFISKALENAAYEHDRAQKELAQARERALICEKTFGLIHAANTALHGDPTEPGDDRDTFSRR